MNLRARAFASAVTVLVVGATYLLTHPVHLPMLWFDPVAHAWSFGARPATVAMDWFGKVAACAVAGLCAYVCAFLASSRVGVSDRALQLAVALATSMSLSCMAYYAVTLSKRAPVKEAYPDDAAYLELDLDAARASLAPQAIELERAAPPSLAQAQRASAR